MKFCSRMWDMFALSTVGVPEREVMAGFVSFEKENFQLSLEE